MNRSPSRELGKCHPAKKPSHLRHVIPGIHVDQPDVLCREHARVIVAMPCKPLVGRARVHCGRRFGAVVAEGIVTGQGAGHVAVAIPQRGHVAQMVGEGLIEGARGGPHSRLDGHQPSGDGVAGADGVGARPRWVFHLVTGEGRAQHGSVGASGLCSDAHGGVLNFLRFKALVARS